MLENWGQMTKAQDDATTIDQAIASAISAHEVDPESHMGAGESIENHRQNEVIDHPAGSVLADKMTSTELIWQDFFTNESVWTNHGNYTYFGGGGCDLNFQGDITPTQIYGAPYDGNFSVDSDKDFTAQYCTQWGRDGSVSRFLLGVCEIISYTANSQPSKGFYFEMINNSCRGKVRFGGNTYQTIAFTPPSWEFMVLRIFWDSTAKSVSFFVNGILLGTINISAFTGGISYPLTARVESTDMDNLYAMTLLSTSFTRYFVPLF